MSNTDKEPGQKIRVLEAAADLILESQDLDAVTMRRVAERAGVALGLANYYFGGRTVLLKEAVRYALNQKIIAGYGDWDFSGMTSLDRVRAVLLGPLEFMVVHPRLSRVSVLFDLEAPGSGDPSDQTFTEMARAIHGLVPVAELPADFDFRLWTAIATVHESFLRPEQCLARTGVDVLSAGGREILAGRLAVWVLGTGK